MKNRTTMTMTITRFIWNLSYRVNTHLFVKSIARPSSFSVPEDSLFIYHWDSRRPLQRQGPTRKRVPGLPLSLAVLAR